MEILPYWANLAPVLKDWGKTRKTSVIIADVAPTHFYLGHVSRKEGSGRSHRQVVIRRSVTKKNRFQSYASLCDTYGGQRFLRYCFPSKNYSTNPPQQGCTIPGRQIAQATKFLPWFLLFLGPRDRCCFVSLFWCPECWDAF